MNTISPFLYLFIFLCALTLTEEEYYDDDEYYYDYDEHYSHNYDNHYHKNDHYHYKTTTTTTATTTTSHQCPTSEWKVFQSHCYLQVKNHKTQKVCRIVCKGEGGELASIHSQEENQFVADMIKQSQRKV